MSWYRPADVGFAVRQQAGGLGYGARLLLRLFTCSATSFGASAGARPVFFLGNYSLAIISVSGLFVGFVLGLQGYYTLQRYGSSEAWACWWR
jgi:phospholipid/cholesterol/gamma-HCH transport system permease protein